MTPSLDERRVLSEQIEESNRETAILFEEFLGRIDAILKGVPDSRSGP